LAYVDRKAFHPTTSVIRLEIGGKYSQAVCSLKLRCPSFNAFDPSHRSAAGINPLYALNCRRSSLPTRISVFTESRRIRCATWQRPPELSFSIAVFRLSAVIAVA
jgi:hypothetical protein